MILDDLISRWLHTAKCKFIQAKDETNPFARRFIEHGAICYSNCASQLKDLLQTNAFSDFGPKILKKNSKRPRSRRF